MRFRVLGPLEIHRDGEPVIVVGEKQRLLQAVLLASANRVASTDSLAESLWPDRQPQDPNKAIQSLVSRLRRRIGDYRQSELITRPPGYLLRIEPTELDALFFEELAQQAAAEHDPEEAVTLLDEALGLWNGPAYAEFSDHEFARLEAIRLEELRLNVVEDRCERLLELGRHKSVIPSLEAFVTVQPLRERARGQLMEALYRSGRQADALHVYREYKQHLAKMGLEPSDNLRELETAILTDEVGRRPQAQVPGTESGVAALSSTEGPGEEDEELEHQAEEALWSGDLQASIELSQQAYAGYVRSGNALSAGRVALALAMSHHFRLRFSVAQGWLHRGRTLLDGLQEAREHGHLAATSAFFALETGELDTGLEHARTASEIGQRLGDSDLQALGLTFEGYGLVRQGLRADGMARIDEAMARAVGGELGLFATGMVYCQTLCACLDLLDYQRAAEWTDEVDAHSATTGTVGFPGDCRTHRVAVLIAKGAWAQGEEEATAAIAESETFDLGDVALATYELGAIRLRLGDLEGAEAAFRRAHEVGGIPQPGQSLLYLARGDVAGAAASIRRALSEAQTDSLTRAKLLPALVEIAIAVDDVETARSSAAELREIADVFGTTALDTAALCSTGAVLLATGESGAAVTTLQKGWHRWHEMGAPYEAARARMLLAQALHDEGDHQGSALEFDAAQASFRRLGARLDAERAAELAMSREL